MSPYNVLVWVSVGRQYPGQGAQKPPGVTIVAISPPVNQLQTGREGGQGRLYSTQGQSSNKLRWTWASLDKKLAQNQQPTNLLSEPQAPLQSVYRNTSSIFIHFC